MKTFDLGAVTAYALAVQNVFKVTMQEWLDSLVGPTPKLTIGKVETLEPGKNATATMGGTPENPVLNLGIPRGENGHAADWSQDDPSQPDYVKNRTHYEDENGVVPLPAKYLPEGVPYVEDAGMVEILPETTLTSPEEEPGEFLLTENPPVLTVGERYIVTWNGVEYGGTAVDVSEMMGAGSVMVANDGADLETNEGIVFLIVYMPDVGNGQPALYVMDFAANATTVTLSIKGEDVTIHKLDTRCLPNGVPYIEGEFVENLQETTFALSGGQGVNEDASPTLVIGETYTVNWDGVDYICVAQDFSKLQAGVVLLGNGVEFGLAGNDEPFSIMHAPGAGVQVNSLSGALTEVTVSIYQDNTIARRLPAACLPTDATELYLTSSGGKRFKITVSDDGALSAAEVTS